MKAHSLIDTVSIHRLSDRDFFVVTGWAFDEKGEPEELGLFLNGEKADFRYETVVRPDVEQRFMHQSEGLYYSGFRGLAEYNGRIENIRLFAGEKLIYSADAAETKRIVSHSGLVYDIEESAADSNGNVMARGWALSLYKKHIDISVIDQASGQAVQAEIRNIPTGDARQEFIIIYAKKHGERRTVCFSTDDERLTVQVTEKAAKDHRIIRLIKKVSPHNIKKFFRYCRRFGFTETVKMVFAYRERTDYDRWFRKRRVTAAALEQQRQQNFRLTPGISILIPAYNTPVDLLRKTVGSVQAQSYENWQLCIAFAGDKAAPAVDLLKRYQQEDKRIAVRFLDENQGISENTNRALEMADGDYIALFDHDDLLEPDALYEMVRAINDEPDQKAFYTDEDKYDTAEKRFVDPNLKPDFDIDLLRSCNYITHFLVVRSDLMAELGGLRSEYDGAQDYDLILRIAEKAGEIKHIPRILYHWRMMTGSTALAPESKTYAYTSGVKALSDHLRRCGIAAEAQMQEKPNYGLYNAYYEPVSRPLVSIIFNGKGDADSRQKCIESIRDRNTYENIEFVDSTSAAAGSLLLFLDENMTLINPDSIRDMAGFFERDDVGVVGAKLLYEDGTVEHAGMIVGMDGFAEYANAGISNDQPGYMMRALLNCDYSAVSGACLMTRKSLYDELHGFDASYKVCGRDVDYCLRVRRRDLLVVYNATSQWYHSGQKFRRQRADYDTRMQVEKDIALFQKRFSAELAEGDRYYNPGFGTEGRPFCLQK